MVKVNYHTAKAQVHGYSLPLGSSLRQARARTRNFELIEHRNAVLWAVMLFRMGDQSTDPVTAVPIERDEIQMMFLRSPDDPAIFGPLWERLEALVGLRGRKFFGAFYESAQEYRVCVQMREGDDPVALGLESGTLPGGRYLRARLHGEPPAVYQRIGPTFQELMKTAHQDETRPSIEFYRQRDEIDLLLPIASSGT